MEIQFRNETKKLRNNEQTLQEDEVSETNITKFQGTVIESRQEQVFQFHDQPSVCETRKSLSL